MAPLRLLVATRSPDKAREIREIVGASMPVAVTSLAEAGVPQHPAEEGLERFDSFEANALAKARYFAAGRESWVLADDSGLCVDALGGAPGVRSKRFAGIEGSSGRALDEANNRHLLDRLQNTPEPARTARYICAVALVGPRGERVYTGVCDGLILREARGTGGFGFDPLFFVPAEGATFGEIPAARKNRISHRARAIGAVGEALLALVDGCAGR